MSNRLSLFGKLRRYSKTVFGLAGALATWAMATYPTKLDVQRYGGLVLVLLTAAGVYVVKNAPAIEPSDPDVSEAEPDDVKPPGVPAAEFPSGDEIDSTTVVDQEAPE